MMLIVQALISIELGLRMRGLDPQPYISRHAGILELDAQKIMNFDKPADWTGGLDCMD